MKLLRDGLLSKNGDEQTRLVNVADEFSKAPIFIDDSSALSIMQLRAKARRIHARTPLGFIVVDYLQLLSPTDAKVPREQQVAEASRGLKSLAKELNVPVVALSQLSRAVEARKPPIPMLADLRESGAIEQDADVVIFIYREDVYDSNSERKGIADIIVSKHRNGPIGKKELFFQDRFAKFESLDLREA